MKSRTKAAALTGIGIASVAALLLALAWRQFVEPARPELPRLAAVQPFSFTDETGASFTEKKLRGKITVFNTFFTSCPGPCLKLTRQVAELDQKFDRHPDIQFVSVSVDPERDTPDVMASYKARFLKTDGRKWSMLTGSAEAIKRLIGGSFNLGTPEAPELHSMRFVAVTGADVRGYYLSTVPEDIGLLERDLDLLSRTLK